MKKWRRRTTLFGVLIMMSVLIAPPLDGEALTNRFLWLNFDQANLGTATGQPIRNSGTALADVALVQVNNPDSHFELSQSGGLALELPDYSGVSEGSYAAVRVTPLGGDWLSPGRSNFRFGADVRLNQISIGTSIDNGNNVMQRGLWTDTMQFKLEVDDGKASCVIRGDEGRVRATSTTSLKSGTWYRLRCYRAGSQVHLTVWQLGSEDSATVTRAEGPIGSLNASASAPLSVGAKMSTYGRIVPSSTDQFNGYLDNISYSISP